jgi:hypothetical protein
VIDFTLEDKLSEHRVAAEKWAADHLRPEWVEEEHRTGTHHNRVLHKLLADEGLLGAGWPREYGGSDVDPGYAQAMFDEIGRFGLRLDGWITTWMVGQTIMAAGDEALKREVLPAALRGEVVIVLGYTEPSCGSDVAAAKTRAIRDGDEWVINGSKMFTSTAHEATHVFLLTRTNTEVPKHRGLSLFLVPLESPGVEISPIYTLGGQRTNATYYGDVRVPDTARASCGPRWSSSAAPRSGGAAPPSPGRWPTTPALTLMPPGSACSTRPAPARYSPGPRSTTRWASCSGCGTTGRPRAVTCPASRARWPRCGAPSTRSGSTPPSEVMREIVAERRLKLPRGRPAS